MNRQLLVVLALVGLSGTWTFAMAKEVSLVVKGTVWDSDSRGFAWYQGLNVEQGTRKAARRGARVSVDGQPARSAISGKGGRFELAFTTSQPTFRLIVEGDRFPRTITQPYRVPEEGGAMDVERVNTPRAEGAEHTWPLAMVAEALGYGSTQEMLAGDKGAIRLLTKGSGADGAPEWVDDPRITFPNGGMGGSSTEPTTTSPFLMRVSRSEYLFPFDMNTRDTFFQLGGRTTGAYLIVVSFAPGEAADKDVLIHIEDTITDELLDPPRPWTFSPLTVSVRNGFATEVRVTPDIE